MDPSEEETEAYIFHCVDHHLKATCHSKIMLLLAEHPVAFINDCFNTDRFICSHITYGCFHMIMAMLRIGKRHCMHQKA